MVSFDFWGLILTKDKEDKFSEADLCREFRGYLEELGFVVHPEVATWDLVGLPPADTSGKEQLINPSSRKDYRFGDQIGIQAKLLANVDVLHQAVLPRSGPAFRMVLVRRATTEFLELAGHLGLCVAVRELRRRVYGKNTDWFAPESGFHVYGSMRRFDVKKQLDLPPIVTDLVAGSQSPQQLTPWRVGALRLCRLLRTKGYLTSADFKAAKVDMRRWKNYWLVESTEMPERIFTVDGWKTIAKWVMIPRGPALPDVGWEKISQQLEKHEMETTTENQKKSA